MGLSLRGKKIKNKFIYKVDLEKHVFKKLKCLKKKDKQKCPVIFMRQIETVPLSCLLVSVLTEFYCSILLCTWAKQNTDCIFLFFVCFYLFFFPSCSVNVLFFLPWQNDPCRLLLPALIITCTRVPSSDMWPVDSTAAEKNHNYFFCISPNWIDWVWRRSLLFDMNLIYEQGMCF